MYVRFAGNISHNSTERLAALKGIAEVRPLGSASLIVAGANSRPLLLPGIHTPPDSSIAPVFYDRSELPRADRLARMSAESRERRMAAARRILTSQLLVHFTSDRSWEALAATNPTGREASVVDGWMLVFYADPNSAMQATEWLIRAGGWEFAPVFARQFYKRQAAGTLRREVNDPLFGKQWHLATSGVNLRMGAAWDTVTGKGINIVVVDDGLWVGHEDLRANAYPLTSNYHRNFGQGPANDPTPQSAGESHGTSCAGLIAAVGFNDLGVIGVAPEARLMGVRYVGQEPAGGEADTARALLWQPDGIVSHVSSNSWGSEDDGIDTGRMSSQQAAAMQKGATEGRAGLGMVYVIAAGNGRGEQDDSSYDEFAGSRYAIAVGAVNREGQQSSYSESGMNVALSALGGEMSPPGMMWTTNNMGADPYTLLQQQFETSTAPINYTDAFNGTSAATPQVSGAVALLLERNPGLGYRDVKEILIRSARRDGLKGGDAFVTNGGGIPFSHSFGAGLLNVSGALDLAANWKNLGQQYVATMTSEDVLPIPNGAKDEGAVYQFDFSKYAAMRVEHVELTVDVLHTRRGDLSFGILSPSGMESIADARPNDDGENFEDYKFTSVRHWGETSTGVWSVVVMDNKKNAETGAVGKVSLKVIGTLK